MTSRLLPVEEWPKLAGTLLHPTWQALDPRAARVLVVEDGEQIVGCISIFPVWHVEGAWTAPARRGSISIGRRLWTSLRALWADLGVSEFVCMATTPEGRRLCLRSGDVTPLTCDHFAVRVRS